MAMRLAWRQKAEQLQKETYALYLAYRDPRVPWIARVWSACVVAYALSPIDLIPDFIPVLGYLDDLVLIPLGISLALRMIPPEVMVDSRARAEQAVGRGGRQGRVAAAVIVVAWLAAIGLTVWLVVRAL
ncbi:MAG TPA: YkvA family protein [Anaerolineae bacterium]|nr:YkvA family protein [Anaerolineae bacterium]